MRGLPLYSPDTHLHGFCSLPNLRVYYIKKILLAKVSQTGFITPSVPFAERQFIKMTGKNPKYTQEFKQTIVNLYHSGKTYNQIKEEYGISHSALANWIKQYSEVKIDDNTVLTANQIKELQKRNAQLEEENLILKKAIAIFTPHSNKD